MRTPDPPCGPEKTTEGCLGPGAALIPHWGIKARGTEAQHLSSVPGGPWPLLQLLLLCSSTHGGQGYCRYEPEELKLGRAGPPSQAPGLSFPSTSSGFQVSFFLCVWFSFFFFFLFFNFLGSYPHTRSIWRFPD